MIALALCLVCATCLACVYLLQRELAAERAGRDARDQAYSEALLKVLEAVQSPGSFSIPTGPAMNLTVSEAEEIGAWERGDSESAADAIMAELDARERMGIETTDAERVHLRNIATGLVSPETAFSENA